jgi:hypothetical protein
MKSALESESSFLEALKSFRKVRSSRSFNIGTGRKRVTRVSRSLEAATTLTEKQGKITKATNDAVMLPLPPKELWSGVAQLLEAHFPQGKVRDEISAAALNQHYEGLRALNFEDINDLSNMFKAEAEASSSSSSSASSTISL